MLARSLLGCFGFSCHSVDVIGVVHGEDAHPGRVGEGDPPDGDGHVRPPGAVGGHERLVVHLVDVVAGEDHDRVGRVVLDHVDVAEDGVGRAAVPLGDPAAGDVRLEHLDAAVVAVEVPRPAEADVVVERAGVVLGEDDDVVDVRVHAVREREVDDPVLAAERDGRLGPDRREDRQALTFATGQDDGHRPLHREVPFPVSGRAAPRLTAASNSAPSMLAPPTAPADVRAVNDRADRRLRGRGAG